MFGFAVILRLLLVLYSLWMDTNPLVKFTDIDYSVFTDAAMAVLQGSSPYSRATYRYTPLLAIMLTPNITIHPLWGKLLFCLCDIIAGLCINDILRHSRITDRQASLLTALWTCNPFVAVISVRGSAESVVVLFVLGTVWGIATRRWRLASVLFGLAVHLKIYPIIYAVPIWFGIDYATALPAKSKAFEYKFWSQRRFLFGVYSAFTFLVFTGCMYLLYGYEFIQETYLYHVIRKDHRHNFSIYFYELYLNYDSTHGHGFEAIASFLPQFGLVLALGVKYASDIPFACFLQTFAFIMLNKVCTSQYFMWYLCFLPLILPQSDLIGTNWKRGVSLLVAWIVAQVFLFLKIIETRAF